MEPSSLCRLVSWELGRGTVPCVCKAEIGFAVTALLLSVPSPVSRAPASPDVPRLAQCRNSTTAQAQSCPSEQVSVLVSYPRFPSSPRDVGQIDLPDPCLPRPQGVFLLSQLPLGPSDYGEAECLAVMERYVVALRGFGDGSSKAKARVLFPSLVVFVDVFGYRHFGSAVIVCSSGRALPFPHCL
ncbi:hypothetical protein DV515_00013048 [Chloebia gouldiae]|uniref:Uncharacterized protein n=1 Tax=Chloebia gouldiae TaxID=44316 RepID=A0A3L8S240_CHLGU|nr:hypothetical protein DV515_00013048 [Chloebia gouldiae]